MVNSYNKFAEESRTFETRVKFIDEIFSTTHSRTQIFGSGVQHKLKKSFDAYIDDVHRSAWFLNGRDPMKILHKIDS